MGVPGFFLWLMKNYKHNGFIFNKKLDTIDYFLIDTNCLIHPVCFKTIADNSHITDTEILESKMMDNVCNYLEFLIDYVKPNKGIYLAIDGVAPIAKIKQQRSRRFKSVADKILWDNIKRKYNKPKGHPWNNSAITPGTLFMDKLHYKLIEWLNSLGNKLHIIYSGCYTPSEGEHKLLQFIRENQLKKIEYTYSIYGLDADLIFLALSTNSNNIFLLREASEFNKNESNKDLNYVSISIMRELIVSTVSKYIINKTLLQKINPTNIINDFIFLCYFLGNDFLPHIPSIDIHNNGIENLIICWAKTLDEENKMQFLLNEKLKINNNFLIKFLNNLAIDEEKILKEYSNKKRRTMICNGYNYEKEIFKIENLQFNIHDPIKLGVGELSEYRERYYKHYWGLDKNEIEEFSENLVKQYIRGINWVTLYYFDKCPSWNWYYPYDHPPFVTDISKYIKNEKIKFKIGSPIKPFMQLLSVLPPQSNYLLPPNMSKLMSSKSLKQLYPIEFNQDFINKKKYWMGIPILPPLEIKEIKNAYNKHKNELTKEELLRNEILNIYELNINDLKNDNI